jgi:hypothetical protein
VDDVGDDDIALDRAGQRHGGIVEQGPRHGRIGGSAWNCGATQTRRRKARKTCAQELRGAGGGGRQRGTRDNFGRVSPDLFRCPA